MGDTEYIVSDAIGNIIDDATRDPNDGIANIIANIIDANINANINDAASRDPNDGITELVARSINSIISEPLQQYELNQINKLSNTLLKGIDVVSSLLFTISPDYVDQGLYIDKLTNKLYQGISILHNLSTEIKSNNAKIDKEQKDKEAREEEEKQARENKERARRRKQESEERIANAREQAREEAETAEFRARTAAAESVLNKGSGISNTEKEYYLYKLGLFVPDKDGKNKFYRFGIPLSKMMSNNISSNLPNGFEPDVFFTTLFKETKNIIQFPLLRTTFSGPPAPPGPPGPPAYTEDILNATLKISMGHSDEAEDEADGPRPPGTGTPGTRTPVPRLPVPRLPVPRLPVPRTPGLPYTIVSKSLGIEPINTMQKFLEKRKVMDVDNIFEQLKRLTVIDSTANDKNTAKLNMEGASWRIHEGPTKQPLYYAYYANNEAESNRNDYNKTQRDTKFEDFIVHSSSIDGTIHFIITIKDLSWEWFNVLTIGFQKTPQKLGEAIYKLVNLKQYAFNIAKRRGWDVDGHDKQQDLGMYFDCYNDTFNYGAPDKYYSFKMDVFKNSASTPGSFIEKIKQNNLKIDDVIMALEIESKALDNESVIRSYNPISRPILDPKKDKLKVDAIEEAAAAAAAASRFAGRKTTNPGDGVRTPAASRGKLGSGSAGPGPGHQKRASFNLNPEFINIDSHEGQEWVGRDTIERSEQDAILEAERLKVAEQINASRESQKNAKIILGLLQTPEANSGLNRSRSLSSNIAILNRGRPVNINKLSTIIRNGVMLNFKTGISDTKSCLISDFNSILPQGTIKVNSE